MQISIDMDKYNALLDESTKIKNIINGYKAEYERITKEYEEKIKKEQGKLKYRERKIKELFPSEYWWTYDVDTSWKRPKKFNIKKVEVNSNGELKITIKESVYKMPWDGYNLEHTYTLERFNKLVKYQTEADAKNAYYNRPCPKCGGIMKYADTEWCDKCMKEREIIKKEFEKNHVFYYPEQDRIFKVKYTDEITDKYPPSCKGFGGAHFTLQRVDTGEIIHTDDMFSCGHFQYNKDDLPEIKFLSRPPL